MRDEEAPELDHLLHECKLEVRLGHENTEGKVNILLQAHLSRIYIESFSLISDQAYVVQVKYYYNYVKMYVKCHMLKFFRIFIIWQ